ncbi:3-oxoacyl-[acyl-carrier-protein] synthase III C-terminal domain-containing protein [Mucilaginibacter sp. P25]
MLEHLRKKMDIASENFYIYMAAIGNTVSSSVPVALDEAMKEKQVTPQTKWLLAGFGVGYSWAGTVITFI